MWGSIAITGALAVAAGSLASRRGRRAILGSVEQDWLAGELEFDRIDPDGATVRMKDGGLFRVFALDGINYDAMTVEEQENLLGGRAGAIQQLGDLGLTVRLFGVKRQRGIDLDAEWPSSVLTEIGEAERATFKASYVAGWYVVIATAGSSVLREAGTKKKRREAPSEKRLREGASKITSILKPYRPEPVRMNDGESGRCPLTGFINYLVCGDLRHDLAPIAANLSAALPASDIVTDKTGTIETFTPVRKMHRVIAVRSWPAQVSGRIVSDVLALTGDIEVAQICVPVSREIVTAQLARKKNEIAHSFFGGGGLGSEVDAVFDVVNDGAGALFRTQFQVTIRAADGVELDDLTERVAAILGRAQVQYSTETAGAPTCWFNRLPGRDTLLRPLRVLDLPIAALWPWRFGAVGQLASPYGEGPVRLFATPSGQAYSFQFHARNVADALGHYLVIAPSGGGKSTLIMHLLAGLAKFDGVRSYVFDSNEGTRFIIEAMGGQYQSYDSLALNPLDVGPENEENRHRLYMMLRALVGDELDEEGEQILSHAVDIAFQLDPPERTINGIFEGAFPRQSAVRRAMSKWAVDLKGSAGLNAHIMNAPHDSLGGFLDQSFMTGINMNEALNDPVVGPPVVAHISAAIKQAARRNEAGFNIFIDEAANLLQNEGFKRVALEMFREYRKLKGCVGLAFQDPKALFDSGIADAVIDNTATFIFFPNSQASPKSLAPFNLNDEQVNFITRGSLEGEEGERRVLIVKREAATGIDESAILDVDLGRLGRDVVRFYRSGSDAARDLEKLKLHWGDAWRDHL